MRRFRSSRTSASNERTESPIVASFAITFIALPPCIVPTVTTAIFVGSTLRATTVCSAITMLETATIGSTVMCGRAAWPPRPLTVIVTRSDADIIGPARKWNVFSGLPG